MRSWTAAVLRWRWLVVAIWVGLAVAGGLLSPKTIDRLGYDFGLPGQPGYETNERILAEFGNGGANDPLALVLRLPAGQTVDAVEVRSQYESALAGLQRPGWRVTSFLDVQAGAQSVLVSRDRRTAVALVYPPVTPGPVTYAAAMPRWSR